MHKILLASIISQATFLMPAFGYPSMVSPPPIQHPANPFTITPDNNYGAPLAPSGSNFPCKGHLAAVGTPEGESVATWAPGSSQSFV